MKQRIVVKIGSSSLTDNKGHIDIDKVKEHTDAIAVLKREGHEVLVISSGAVAAGFSGLGYPSRPVTLAGKQAAAAVGQSILMQQYTEHFSLHQLIPAQILLTKDDFREKQRYHNAYNTLIELLERGIIPIINENDSVAVDELTFGDNDMLSAMVSGLVHADQLIILTDINGLYTANPSKDAHAKKISHLDEVTDEWLQVAGDSGSNVGTGGMKSKLLAARRALSLGVKVFIGKGSGSNKLLNIINNEGDGTYVGTDITKGITHKKQWIAFHSTVGGQVIIDKGAEDALFYRGKSLLPAGITRVKGTFERGEVVEVFGPVGFIGKGETMYSSQELEQIKGCPSAALQTYENYHSTEVIHRDKWVNLKH